MAEPNPSTEGAVKSLRQQAPGGDIIPAVFAAIAALLLLGVIRTPPGSLAAAVVDLVLVAAFALPAYLLYAGSRGSGLFITEARVEYRSLGRVRESWPRAEVGQVVPMSGRARLLGVNGAVLREYRFRWWNTAQVDRFARAAGLAPPSALDAALAESAASEGAAPVSSGADPDPGKAGDGREQE